MQIKEDSGMALNLKLRFEFRDEITYYKITRIYVLVEQCESQFINSKTRI